MCGITGCVFKNVIDFDHQQFKKINDLISHRGPDYSDVSFFKSADASGVFCIFSISYLLKKRAKNGSK